MIDKIFEKTKEKALGAAPIGGKLKFMIDDTAIFIDGTGQENIVELKDADADTTVSVSAENFVELATGKLNPMMAVMTQKVKIKGDMGLALKLQSLI